MREVAVELKIKILIHADEDERISDVVNEMGYTFVYTEPGAEIIEAEMGDYEIKDN